MNVSLLRRATAFCVMLALIVTMSACYHPPTAVITDPQSTPTTQSTGPTATPTLPPKDGQLTLSLLIGVMSSNMKWSQLSSYTHTDVDDTHATFTVADNYGKECTLNVTYDAQSDAISEATLVYGSVSVDVLSDNTLVIRDIMLAMNE